jgi:hypothetical protein
MNITITKPHIARAQNVVGQAPEAIADLVESEGATVIGIFPTHLVEEPWRAHLLAGEAVVEITEDVAILWFESSTASFGVKQIIRLRELKRKEEAEEARKRGRRREVA